MTCIYSYYSPGWDTLCQRFVCYNILNITVSLQIRYGILMRLKQFIGKVIKAVNDRDKF